MYRKVDRHFWDDVKVRKMDPISKLLFLYLVTGPDSDVSGVFRYDVDVIATHLGCSPKSVERRLTVLEKARLLTVSPENHLMLVRKMFQYQGSRSPLVLTHVRNHLERFEGSRLVASFKRAYPWVFDSSPKPEPGADTVSETVSKTVSDTSFSSEQLAVNRVIKKKNFFLDLPHNAKPKIQTGLESIGDILRRGAYDA